MANFIEAASIDVRIKWCKWIMTSAAALACMYYIIQMYTLCTGRLFPYEIWNIVYTYLLYLMNFSFGYLLFSTNLPKMRIAGIYMMSGVGFSCLYTLMQNIFPLIGLAESAYIMTYNGYIVLMRLIIPNLLEAMAIVTLCTIPMFNKDRLMKILILWLVQFGIVIVWPVQNIFSSTLQGYIGYVIIGGINTIIYILSNGTLLYLWLNVTNPDSEIAAEYDGEYSMDLPWKNRLGIGFALSMALLCMFAFAGCIIAKSVV